MENLLILKDLNGKAVLIDILKHSTFGSLEQAVASLTLFSHPNTVKQLDYKNVFRIIRTRSAENRGKYDVAQNVMFDDNKGPTDAFIWAHGIKRRYVDIQFNHVWDRSTDVESYTNLANICVTPAFLSKATDTEPAIQDLLRYRSFDLYDGWCPEGISKPRKPDVYDSLKWASPLPTVLNLEKVFRKAMETKPRDRTTICARKLGWHFSDDLPDSSI